MIFSLDGKKYLTKFSLYPVNKKKKLLHKLDIEENS